MSKSGLRKILFFLLPFLVSYTLFLAGACLSDAYLTKVIALIHDLAGPQLSVSAISFSPIRGIQAKEVRFEGDTHWQASLRDVEVRYSFFGLLKKDFVLKKVSADQCRVVFLNDFLPKADEKIFPAISPIYPLSRNFKITPNQAIYHFSNLEVVCKLPTGQSDKLVYISGFDTSFFRNRIISTGRLDYKKLSWFSQEQEQLKKALPLSHIGFLLDVELVGEDLAVNHVTIRSGAYGLSVTGLVSHFIRDPFFDLSLHVNPAIRLDKIKTLKPFQPSGGEITLTGFLKGDRDHLILQTEVIMPFAEFVLEDEKLELSSFVSSLSYDFSSHVLKLERLTGTIDETLRISAGGQIKNLFSPRLDLQCDFTSMSSLAGEKRRTTLLVNGDFSSPNFLGNVRLFYPGYFDKEYVCTLKNLKFHDGEWSNEFQKLGIQIANVELAEYQVSKKGREILQNFNFRNLDLSAKAKGRNLSIDRFLMYGYEGRIFGNSNFHFKRGRQDYSVSAVIDQLHFKNRKIFFPLYCEAGGVVSGKIALQNHQGDHLQSSIIP